MAVFVDLLSDFMVNEDEIFTANRLTGIVFHMGKPFRTCCLLLFLLAPFFPGAAVTAAPLNSDAPPKKGIIARSIPFVDRTQRQISKGVIASARKIDSFFRDPTYLAEENTTSLRLLMGVFQEEGQSPEFQFNPLLRLVLPYTEKRLLLEVISTADENLEFLDQRLPFNVRQYSQSNKEPTTATLQYFLKAKEKLNLSMTAGARWEDGAPVFHAGPRYRTAYARDFWGIQLVEWVRWDTDAGLEARSEFDVDVNMRKDMLFRTRLAGTWHDDEDDFPHSVSFQLFHQIRADRAMAYEINNFMTTVPNHRLEEIRFRIKYRQQIWREWFFYEVAPQLSFPRDQDFDLTPGILFQIELYFGP